MMDDGGVDFSLRFGVIEKVVHRIVKSPTYYSSS